jgi:glycosyltransferase involved in cell wall biosynthesis
MEVMLRVSKPEWETEQIDVEILAADKTEGPYARELRNAGYKVHHFGFAKTPLHFWRYFSFLRSHRYDVVHLHVERAMVYYGVLAWLAGVPRIVKTQHNQFQFTGLLRYRRRWQRWLLRSLGVTFVSIGPSVTATEWKYFRNPTVVIPNWFDANRFRPPSSTERQQARKLLSVAPGQFVIVTIGNCSPVKNHGMLIEALAAAMGRGIDFVYLHIGQEEHSIRERELAARVGIGGRTRFLGRIDDPIDYLWAADLYVMCSTREGFSIAALEAMGTGVPMLLTDVPGLRDLHNIAPGIIWAKLNSASLADGVAIADSLSEAGRSQLSKQMSQVRQQFYPGVGVSGYAALYRNQTCRLTMPDVASEVT